MELFGMDRFSTELLSKLRHFDRGKKGASIDVGAGKRKIKQPEFSGLAVKKHEPCIFMMPDQDVCNNLRSIYNIQEAK